MPLVAEGTTSIQQQGAGEHREKRPRNEQQGLAGDVAHDQPIGLAGERRERRGQMAAGARRLRVDSRRRVRPPGCATAEAPVAAMVEGAVRLGTAMGTDRPELRQAMAAGLRATIAT